MDHIHKYCKQKVEEMNVFLLSTGFQKAFDHCLKSLKIRLRSFAKLLVERIGGIGQEWISHH